MMSSQTQWKQEMVDGSQVVTNLMWYLDSIPIGDLKRLSMCGEPAADRKDTEANVFPCLASR